MKKISLIAFFLHLPLLASEFSVNPSFQGYTGVINTPNAQVIQEGHMAVHFNNQFDNSIISYDYNKYHRYQEDYIVGFGVFSFMEVQGRLSEARGFHRDLSANVKFKWPYHYKYFPDIAVGVQDLGGEVDFYDNQYLVLDKELWNIRASLGYGHSSSEFTNRKRMDGVFGSIEYKTTNWLYLMAENDTKENHIGLRLETPKSWIKAFSLRATAVRNVTSGENSLGFTMDIPLYHDNHLPVAKNDTQKGDIVKVKKKEKKVDYNSSADYSENFTLKLNNSSIKSIDSEEKLKKYFANFGFENVNVAKKKEKLYVEIENTIFDFNDLDALGFVIGTISNSDMNITNYKVILLVNQLQTLVVEGDCKSFKNYILNPNTENKITLANSLHFSRDVNTSGVFINKAAASSIFKPRVELSPGISTIVGNEQGIFHYFVSLRAKAYMNLYKGLSISASYYIPIAESEEYREGGHFYNSKNYESRFTNIMAHQTIHYKNLLNTISFGKYLTDYTGIMNQTDYTTTDGVHAFRWYGGKFTKNATVGTKVIERSYTLGTYRYFYAPMDFYTEFTYGKYWSGDVGYQVNFKRFFSDVSVELYYKASKFAGDIGETKIAGLAISFPLTTRRVYNNKYIQLKGKKDFYYALKTTVDTGVGVNPLNGTNALIPTPDFEITSTYLNRDRLGSKYVKNHLARLRDAYLEYKDDK